ncbi:hypothetical protein DDV93_20765 [Cereibacter johrii]|nr:hypothetical protein DDV93_20765 [Cereibacter johrii]
MRHHRLAVAAAALCFQTGAPAQAEMSDKDAAVAALALLGVAALAHNRHHHREGYAPQGGDQMAEFERGYRDGVHGHAYNSHGSTVDYAEGYQAGDRERENSMAHRRNTTAASKAPPMANQGCARIVAQNFAVGTHQVHIIRARSPAKHEWQIEAAVGHSHMVCRMRDSGEVIEVRGGRV